MGGQEPRIHAGGQDHAQVGACRAEVDPFPLLRELDLHTWEALCTARQRAERGGAEGEKALGEKALGSGVMRAELLGSRTCLSEEGHTV